MGIILIALTDTENGIGDGNGNLLFKIPKDMKRFKEITTGKHVVMGRKTWESLPVKPLPKRKNYVLTFNEDYEIKGRTQILHTIQEILELSKGRDVYVIGGGELYFQLMPYADKLEITHIHTRHPIHDSEQTAIYFPDIDVKQWKLVKVQVNDACTEKGKEHPSYTFATYERKPVEPTETNEKE